MENFRQPNFRLVAELMTWLVKQWENFETKTKEAMSIHFRFRYDPQVDVPQDIEGEQDRVIFIRTVAQIIVRKQNMK